MLVACGTASIVAAVVAGTGLDGMYVLWSALTLSQRSSEVMAAVAPYSIMSPLLIWGAVALGTLLMAIGLRLSLRDPRKSSSESGSGNRGSDGSAVDDTVRAWTRSR